MRFSQALQARGDLARPRRIDVAEWSSPERREAQSQNRADVAVPRGADDPFLKTMNGLVHHRKDDPVADLLRAVLGGSGGLFQERSDLGIRALGALSLRPRRIVKIEPPAVLPAGESRLVETREQIRSLHSPVGEGASEVVRDMSAHVDPDLVE